MSKNGISSLVVTTLSIWATLSLSYYLGFSFAHTPPIWLSTGFALCAFFNRAPRSLCGTFVGATLGHLIYFHYDSTFSNWHLLGISAGLGLTLAIQVGIVGWLLQQLQRDPNNLSLRSPVELLHFSILAGPIGATIGATLSIALLNLCGVLPVEVLGEEWLRWWLADCIGVLITTPLALSFCRHTDPEWRIHRQLVGIPILIFLTIAIFFTAFQNVRYEHDSAAFLSNEVDQISKRLTNHLRLLENDLMSVVAFFRSSNYVDAQEFDLFTDGLLTEKHSFKQMIWAPRVLSADRATYELDQENSLHIQQPIQTLSAEGVPILAEESNDYFPIAYYHPRHESYGFINIDILSLNGIPTPTILSLENTPMTTNLIQKGVFISTSSGEQAMMIYSLTRGYAQEGLMIGIQPLGELIEKAKYSSDSASLVLTLYDPHTQLSYTEDNVDIPPKAPMRSVPLNLTGGSLGLTVHALPAFFQNEKLQRQEGNVIIAFLFVLLVADLLLILAHQSENIREQVNLQTRRLRQLHCYTRVIMESRNAGQLGITLDGHILFSNRTAEIMLGWERGELMEKTIDVLTKDTDLFLEILNQDSPLQTLPNHRFLTAEGQGISLNTSVVPIYDEEELIGSLLTITSQRSRAKSEKQNRLSDISAVDPLTQLPNRAAFERHLAGCIKQSEQTGSPFSIIILDLDDFKQVNASIGHQSGDQLLIHIAQRLQTACEDCFVARVGGDEFALMPTSSDTISEILTRTQSILNALQDPFQLEGRSIRLTGSMGIVMYPEGGRNLTDLMKNIDAALYQAKDSGKNQFALFSPSLQEARQETLQLTEDLRHAIEHDELFLVFQPIVNLSSQQIVSLEALLRWEHPTMGLVPPARFIDIAENYDLIEPIGAWVFEHAAKASQDIFDSTGKKIRVYCNVSPKQLANENFSKIALNHIGLNATKDQLIGLEVTETAIMENQAPMQKALTRLSEAGYRISIDDFGTGYSSLARVKTLPVNSLKIDASFVSDIPNEPQDCAIVSSIIQLGASLELDVIAEGVEREDQVDYLRNAGCFLAQGYFFHRPMPLSDLLSILKSQ